MSSSEPHTEILRRLQRLENVVLARGDIKASNSQSAPVPCHLTWDESTAPLTLTIRSSAPVKTRVDVSRDVQSITFSEPEELTVQQLPLVQLTTRHGPEQTWILQFDSRHIEWSATRYRSFVQWFIARGNAIVSQCRPLEAETIWDAANRAQHGKSHVAKLDLASQSHAIKCRMKARKQTQDSTRVASDLRPSKVVPFLPIKAWYLGRKLFEEPYHLVWLHSGRLSIRSGEAPGAPPRHSENVDMKTIVSKVWFVNPADSQNKSVFFETNESIPRSGQKELGAEYSKFFKQGGKLCEGDIAIQFDSDSSNWSPYSYLVFVDWLKCNVDHRQVLGGLAGNAKWDVIPLITERVETKLRRGFAVDGTRDATTPTATRSQTKRKADDDATEESGCSKKIKVEET